MYKVVSFAKKISNNSINILQLESKRNLRSLLAVYLIVFFSYMLVFI